MCINKICNLYEVHIQCVWQCAANTNDFPTSNSFRFNFMYLSVCAVISNGWYYLPQNYLAQSGSKMNGDTDKLNKCAYTSHTMTHAHIHLMN